LVTVMVWAEMTKRGTSRWFPCSHSRSVTVTVIGNVPRLRRCAGETPEAERVRPSEAVLEVVKVTAPIAPLCVNVALNGVPTVSGRSARIGDCDGLAGDRQCVRRASAGAAFESVTLTVIGNDPVWVGVPERTPEAERLIPAGSVPLASEKVAVPFAPLCVKVWLTACRRCHSTRPVGDRDRLATDCQRECI